MISQPMKVSAESVVEAVADDKSRFAIFMELVKARLTLLVLLTTLVGYYIGSRGPMDLERLFHTMAGTAIIACAAAALNQFMEIEEDAKMRRTEDRPLPSGRLQARSVLLGGGVGGLLGLGYLAYFVNPLTAFLGAATMLSYLLIYTPLKKVTTLNTAIGAIPGALPPLMGWAAAQGSVSAKGWCLFAILFFWQLPHFLAIAWLYKEEYARAGFAMLPVLDPSGERTGRSAVSHTLGLLPVSLCPAVFQMAGVVYFLGALVLGLVFLWYSIQFARQLTPARARQLFFVSILYLPALLGLMVLDKVK
jgi:protoheme IX farnesyltransferase